MEKNKVYFVKTEDEDAFKFEKLAYQTGWWKSIEREAVGSDIDYNGVAIDNRNTIIELKTRNMSVDEYDSYFIESDKLADCFLYAAFYNATPLYINFFEDGKVLIWNLNELETMPTKERLRRKNPGFNTMEVNTLYKLAKSDAYEYQLIL